MLGRSGLDINNPAKQYKLKSLPGEFSGLHLLAIMYTAFQQIDQSADIGAETGADIGAGWSGCCAISCRKCCRGRE